MPEPGAIAPAPSAAAGQGAAPAPAGDPLRDDWGSPPRELAVPVLHLDGFDGPLDLLLDLAERQRIDLGRLSVRALAEQCVAALTRLGERVPVERRADWLVLAARLLWLRARLLVPATPGADAEAGLAGAQPPIADRTFVRAATAWLQARPQLGHDVLARPHPAPPRAGGYVALLEACLVVLQGREGRSEQAPLYRPVIPHLWRVTDALARIRMLLDAHPGGGALTAFLPPLPKDAGDRAIRVRAAVAGSLAAALQLAREGNVALAQTAPFAPITLQAVTRTMLEREVAVSA